MFPPRHTIFEAAQYTLGCLGPETNEIKIFLERTKILAFFIIKMTCSTVRYVAVQLCNTYQPKPFYFLVTFTTERKRGLKWKGNFEERRNTRNKSFFLRTDRIKNFCFLFVCQHLYFIREKR